MRLSNSNVKSEIKFLAAPSPRNTGLEKREDSDEALGALYGVNPLSRLRSPESSTGLPGIRPFRMQSQFGEYRPMTNGG